MTKPEKIEKEFVVMSGQYGRIYIPIEKNRLTFMAYYSWNDIDYTTAFELGLFYGKVAYYFMVGDKKHWKTVYIVKRTPKSKVRRIERKGVPKRIIQIVKKGPL